MKLYRAIHNRSLPPSVDAVARRVDAQERTARALYSVAKELNGEVPVLDAAVKEMVQGTVPPKQEALPPLPRLLVLSTGRSESPASAPAA